MAIIIGIIKIALETYKVNPLECASDLYEVYLEQNFKGSFSDTLVNGYKTSHEGAE